MTYTARRPVLVLGLALLLLAGGCCTPCADPCARVVRCEAPVCVAAPVVATPVAEAMQVEAVADAWMARARAVEPELTRLLTRLAADAGGELLGLDHRLKTRTSTISKIERLLARTPGTRPEDVEVYDAVRYTMRVDDEPPGHHDNSLRAMFAELEAVGHEVTEVKNYWPRGDTYNGVNCKLRTPDGLPWELQFHTTASYAMKSKTHDGYERMRDHATPLSERRRLFEEMTDIVDTLPIPAGVLEPKSLHATEEPRLRPLPTK